MFSAIRAFDTEPVPSPASLDLYLALSAAIMAQAARDAQAGDLEACEYFSSPAGMMMLEAIGIDAQLVEPVVCDWAAHPAGKIVVRLDWRNHGEETETQTWHTG
jgi:hypothetical protein